MDRVFEIYIPGENASAWVSGFCLPATPWEMWDTVDQLGVDRLECLGFEVEKYHRGAFLEGALNHSITLPQLNILAWKLAEMDAVQETALEGLIKMEQRKQGDASFTFPTLLKLAENTGCCQVVRAANDSQLGRFYAENGFLEGTDEMPDELFRLLDLEKIGNEARSAEGGVFTRNGCYVVKQEEMREPAWEPAASPPGKPPYTIRLEIGEKEQENGPKLSVELPVLEGMLEELAAKYPGERYEYRCADCAVPFLIPCLEGEDVTLDALCLLARRLEQAEGQGDLAKYKALLQASGCRDVELAAELGSVQVLEQYRFISPAGEIHPAERYAREWLEERLGEDAALIPEANLESLGLTFMERDHVEETCYGLIRRVDGQPIQSMEQDPEAGFQMGGMGGM